jgi:hypothetical protein
MTVWPLFYRNDIVVDRLAAVIDFNFTVRIEFCDLISQKVCIILGNI